MSAWPAGVSAMSPLALAAAAENYNRAEPINALSLGVSPNAVQASNGSWSGTDNSAALERIFTQASATKTKVVIPGGDYIVNAGIFPSGTNLSDLWIEGSPDTRLIITKTSGSALGIIGTRDAVNIFTRVLTSTAAINTRTLTMNTTAGITAGMTIAIKDNSQPILFDSTQTGLLGEINEVYSVDSATQITLAGETQFAYGSNVTPSLSTSIHRWNAPATNVTFANLVFEFDTTLSYVNTGLLFDLQVIKNLIIENVRINNCGFASFNLNDVIGGRISGGNSLRVVPSDVYTVKAAGATSDLIVEDFNASYGRHAFTTTNLSNGLETSFVTVKNCISRYASLSSFDTHTGARNIVFDNCTAIGEGDFGTSSGHGIGSGFQLRGRFCTAQNPHVSGYYNGITFAFGQNSRVIGGEINSCQYGIVVTRHPYVEATGLVFRNIAQSVLDINDGTILASGLAQPGLIIQGRLEGDCAGVVALNETAVVGTDWLIDIEATGATHGQFSGGLAYKFTPRFHTGGLPARVSTDGTDTTPVITETYNAEVLITDKVVVNGLSFFNGSAVSGNIKGYLADYKGVVVASTASTAQAGVDSYQRVPLSSTYLAQPGIYYVCLQVDNTTARFNTHTFGDFGASKKTSTVYGTLASITAPTTFTANLGPIATVY
jgi:hypothetical protein